MESLISQLTEIQDNHNMGLLTDNEFTGQSLDVINKFLIVEQKVSSEKMDEFITKFIS